MNQQSVVSGQQSVAVPAEPRELCRLCEMLRPATAWDGDMPACAEHKARIERFDAWWAEKQRAARGAEQSAVGDRQPVADAEPRWVRMARLRISITTLFELVFVLFELVFVIAGWGYVAWLALTAAGEWWVR